MSIATIAARDLRSPDAPLSAVALPARTQVRTSRSGARRFTFWPLEALRLVAVVYMVPLVILAVGAVLALAINAVLFGASWIWRTAW